MNTETFTTVSYTLENGTRIVQPINKEAFFTDRGRKRTEADLHRLFQETAWDKRAVSYTIDSETNEEVVYEKEIHFSRLDKKLAKAQHSHFMKSMPQAFKKDLKEFQKHLVDVVTNRKRIGINIYNITLQ